MLGEGSVCEGEGKLEEGCVGLSCGWAGGVCMCMLEEYVQESIYRVTDVPFLPKMEHGG